MKLFLIISFVLCCILVNASADTTSWILLSEGKRIIESDKRTLCFVNDSQYLNNQSLIVFESSMSELISSYYSKDKAFSNTVEKLYIDFRIYTDSNKIAMVNIRGINVVEKDRIVKQEEGCKELEQLISEEGFSVFHSIYFNKENTDLYFTLVFRKILLD